MKKQYFIALGAISAITPVVAVVSCNSKTASSPSESKTSDVQEVASLLRSKTTHAHDVLPTEVKNTQESVLNLLQLKASDLKGAHLENIKTSTANDASGFLNLSLDVVQGSVKESLQWSFSDMQTPTHRQDDADLASIKSLPRVFHPASADYTGSFAGFTGEGGGMEIASRIGYTAEGHPELTLQNWQAELQVGDLDKIWAPYHFDASNITKVEYIYVDPNFDITDKGFSEIKYEMSDFKYGPITKAPNTTQPDTIFFYLTVTKGNVSQRLHCCVTGIDPRGITHRGE